MTESADEIEPQEKEKKERKPGRSMFGPILLIGIGVILLLANLGRLPELNWQAALNLWPLLLIFIGLNIIVRQVPRPFGTWLSLLVALITVAVFGYVLLFSGNTTIFSSNELWSPGIAKQEQVSTPVGDVTEASITIEFNSAGGDVFALRDSLDLIEADVSYNGEMVFDSEVSGDKATVHLETVDNQGLLFWANPESWFGSDEMPRWNVGIDPLVSTDLIMNLASGSVVLDLAELTLSELIVDGGSGSADIRLPDGDYDGSYDVGSGRVSMTLPAQGQQEFIIDGGSGSLTIYVPDSTEVSLEADMGSGGLRISDDRFSTDSADSSEDQIIWRTDGFGQGDDQIELFIDVGSGSVRVVEK
jgi:hypothetical protein